MAPDKTFLLCILFVRTLALSKVTSYGAGVGQGSSTLSTSTSKTTLTATCTYISTTTVTKPITTKGTTFCVSLTCSSSQFPVARSVDEALTESTTDEEFHLVINPAATERVKPTVAPQLDAKNLQPRHTAGLHQAPSAQVMDPSLYFMPLDSFLGSVIPRSSSSFLLSYLFPKVSVKKTVSSACPVISATLTTTETTITTTSTVYTPEVYVTFSFTSSGCNTQLPAAFSTCAP